MNVSPIRLCPVQGRGAGSGSAAHLLALQGGSVHDAGAPSQPHIILHANSTTAFLGVNNYQISVPLKFYLDKVF